MMRMMNICILLSIIASFLIQESNSFSANFNALRLRRTSVLPRVNGIPLAAKGKWDREALGDAPDIFDEDTPSLADEIAELEGSSGSEKKKRKPKVKLEAEITFFEGPPSPTEILLPALSILTVIGIIPFTAALARQIWVRYKFTSRRISIQSGIGGKMKTEIIYQDVSEIRFAYRGFGASGDMVLFLKDGAKVELRHVPKFKEIYDFVLSKCDEECRAKSMKAN